MAVMAPHRPALEDLVQRLAPPGQPDLSKQRVGGHLGRPRELVVVGVEGDDVGALARIVDEAAGEPAIGIDALHEGVEVFRV